MTVPAVGGVRLAQAGNRPHTGRVTNVVFVHGVGGPTSDWHEPLVRHLSASGVDQMRPSTVRYDDLLQCRQLIIRAARDLEPVEQDDSVAVAERERARQGYMTRRQELADAVAASPDCVPAPRVKPPPLLLGEALVRLPVLNMRQAGHYRHNAGARDAVLDRLADALIQAGDDTVVVAHSLGSVIAVDALHSRDVRIGLLITIGSPLGLGRFWCGRWAGDEDFPHHRVGSWLNVVNLRDPVPWQRGVSRRFPAAVDAFIEVRAGVAGVGGVHDPVVYTGSGPALLAVHRHLGATDRHSPDRGSAATRAAIATQVA